MTRIVSPDFRTLPSRTCSTSSSLAISTIVASVPLNENAEVREVTRSAKSDADKIDAILHWTAQEIRYSGISMGKGEGYVLHPGQMTFNDRAGVWRTTRRQFMKLSTATTLQLMIGCTPEDVIMDGQLLHHTTTVIFRGSSPHS